MIKEYFYQTVKNNKYKIYKVFYNDYKVQVQF